MITIALDEGGHFENLKPSENCMYIGGIVFQCKDDEARKKELKRLQNYLMGICANEGCKYPQDLHYNWVDGQIINVGTATKVKNAVISTLPDFLNGKGKWSMNAPKGTYYLYALVGDKNGINYFEENGINTINSDEEISNLIDDNVSGNRYEHMAYRTLENLLFYNTRFKDNNVRLNLATRVINLKNDGDLEKEAIRTGLEKHRYESTFKATTLSSYRAALVSMVQDSNRKNIHFDDINVESIFYEDNPQHNLNQGFLYLSDIVCNIYASILGHCNQADTGIEKLWLNCQQYAPQRFYIWSYNDFDQKYRAIYKSFVNKNYYTTLKDIYFLSRGNEKSFKVYNALWFDDIKRGILFSNSEDEFSYVQASITTLERELSNSVIKVDEARSILNFLKSKAENLCKKSSNETKKYGLLYNLYKSEMAIFNHEGNPKGSDEAFKKCTEYSRYVNVEDFMELQNMYSVKLCDSLDFEKAIRLTAKNCEYEDMLHSIKEEINPSETKYIHQGRTYSQLAQCYSFVENYEKATEYFIKAFECYGDDDFNRTITMSFFLHMLIEQKNIDGYKKYAKEYFGNDALKEQFLNIVTGYESDQNSNKWMFMLNVYMKALYILFSEELKNTSPKLLKELLLKFECLKNISNKSDHPWELIYKYAAFCCLKVGNKEFNEKAEKYIQLARTSIVNVDGGVLQKIIDEIDIQYQSVLEGKAAFEKSNLTYMYR